MIAWLRAQLTALAGKRVRGLSLVANYLANVLWQVDNTWRSLMREGYGRNSVAYAALRLLSQSVPEARMRCYTGEDDDRAKLPNNHPLQQLILRPNLLMTEFEMWELTTLQLAGGGRSVWWKERANNGLPLALWPLRPDRVGPIYSNDPASPVIAGWSYSDPDGGVTPLRAGDCVVYNFPDPDGESGGIVEGLGSLSPGRADISADNMATQHMGALLANYAQPGVAIEVQDAVDEDTAKLIKAKFRQEFGGRGIGTPAIIDAGAKITMLGFNLRDLEFTGLRADTESRICAVLGVPSIMVGVNSGLASSTYSNYESARLAFTESTLAFYWRRYADQFTMDLAPDFGDGITCEFDTSKVKALAAQFEAQLVPWAAAYTTGALTVNEYRGKLGIDALPTKVGDVLMVPGSSGAVGATEELIAADEAAAAEMAEQVAQQQPAQEPGVEDKPEMEEPEKPIPGKSIEAIRFIPNGAEEPRVLIPGEVVITEYDIEHAMDDWNTLMPEYAGLLDSPIVNKQGAEDAQ